MVELSELVSVSKQAISQYEMGKNAPSKSILNAIATELKYPVSFFYKPVPANENASSAVFFRSRKTAKVKALNAAREKIEIFREINDYLDQYVDFPMLDLPKITYEDDGINPIDNEQIEKYAMTLREHWGLGKGPIDNLINIVQKNGIMVSKMQLRLNKLDAFSVWFDNKPFIFLSSDKDTNVRIRFDIAHAELRRIVNVIVWNLWQMDGISGTVPFGKPKEEYHQFSLFDFVVADEPDKQNIEEPEEVYCRIYDWRSDKSLTYKSMKEGR